jgi:glucose-1-phosphate thymidylyltransferase|tara:strand:+ start:163 stop:1398 length:1236 start_codon:yes stop_codon:yes gene_type:complete
MNIILYENSKVEDLYPITLTRPSFDILCAGMTLYDAVKKVFPKVGIDVLVRKYLSQSAKARFKNSSKKIGKSILFLDGSIVPDLKQLELLAKKVNKGKSFVIKNKKEIIGAHINLDEHLISKSKIQKLKHDEVIGFLESIKMPTQKINLDQLQKPWHAITFNKKILASNLKHRSNQFSEYEQDVFFGNKVHINEHVVFDASKGPIVIDSGTHIKLFTYLVGPLYIGKNCTINEHASIKESCIGDMCKVGGEVDVSIMQGYSNKQHYGVLAYSWVGEWVNLGGGTSTSDLKNTYGTISMHGEDTGQLFMGCVIADYAKTSIQAAIMPGRIIGVNSTVLGLVTKDVPSFTNYLGGYGKDVAFDLSVALEVQKRMLLRRNVQPTKLHRALLEKVFEMTNKERKEAAIKKGKISL